MNLVRDKAEIIAKNQPNFIEKCDYLTLNYVSFISLYFMKLSSIN